MRSIFAPIATVAVATSLSLFAACGPSTPPPGTAGAGTPSATPTTSATESAAPTTTESASAKPAVVVPATWKDAKTKEEKVAFMKEKVKPTLGDLFKAYDGTKYADFGCQSCHGKGQAPTDFLPKLTFKDGKITAAATNPKMVEFMHSKVVPAMAGLFGEQPFDPATKTGFGCKGCHTVEMK
jgi:hypothetical protein